MGTNEVVEVPLEEKVLGGRRGREGRIGYHVFWLIGNERCCA